MLGRRQIREKVVETLYSYYQNPIKTDVLERNMLTEIEKIKRSDWPAITILPEYGSTKKLALTRLENNLARAIGKKV